MGEEVGLVLDEVGVIELVDIGGVGVEDTLQIDSCCFVSLYHIQTLTLHIRRRRSSCEDVQYKQHHKSSSDSEQIEERRTISLQNRIEHRLNRQLRPFLNPLSLPSTSWLINSRQLKRSTTYIELTKHQLLISQQMRSFRIQRKVRIYPFL